jgi:histidinol-phosphate aminotransferase
VLSPRAVLNRVPQYHPPLAGRDGLRLDFNENTVGCSPRVLARLQKLTADDLTRYPQRKAVEARVAEFLEIDCSQLLLTNGVDEAIHLLCQTYLDPGDEALIVVPTYSMYRIYMSAAGANVISVPSAENFNFPVSAVLNHVSPRIRLIAIANPNNPSGTVARGEDLLQIAKSASHAAVLIDEAYFEFYKETLLDQCRKSPNLFVARTFSKAYGLAGLRAGALAGHNDQMDLIRRVCSPYNVNAAALACLPAAMADAEYVREYVNEVVEGRIRLEGVLAECRIPFWPSQANFVLARIGSTDQDSSAFVEEMRKGGILVRDRSSDPGCLGCVRITLGSRKQTDRLLLTLREVWQRWPLAQGAARP